MSDAFTAIQRIDNRLAEIQRRASTLRGLTPAASSTPVTNAVTRGGSNAVTANADESFQSTFERMLSGTSPTSSPTNSLAATSATATSRYAALHQAPGSYGRLVVPAELSRYPNGALPASALQTIGQGAHRLSTPAASAFRSMAAVARADGVELTVSDSYRTYDQQVTMQQTRGNYADGGFAAIPGTSPHGWGLAVDLDTSSTTQQWMRQNAWQFGFAEDVAREPWHWTFRGASLTPSP